MRKTSTRGRSRILAANPSAFINPYCLTCNQWRLSVDAYTLGLQYRRDMQAIAAQSKIDKKARQA